jgi:alkylation response protein AidB-like acyl-CoA dehydrogenase
LHYCCFILYLPSLEQKREFIQGRLEGKVAFTFGLTEPNHGSDATHMFTHGIKTTRNGVDGWIINGSKMWISGIHRATHCLVFARTNGKPGDAIGITAFFVPKNTPVRRRGVLVSTRFRFLTATTILFFVIYTLNITPKRLFTGFHSLLPRNLNWKDAN